MDPKHYVGEIQWVPLSAAAWWQISLDAMTVSAPMTPLC
jgi:hypothetical protein